jgi:hypothetical protein
MRALGPATVRRSACIVRPPVVIPIYAPRSQADLQVVLCLLDAYGFPYFVHNYFFGALYPGPQIDLYNRRRVFVRSEMAADAKQLIDDFLPDIESDSYAMSSSNKLRVVVEYLLLGWFLPGSRARRHETA